MTRVFSALPLFRYYHALPLRICAYCVALSNRYFTTGSIKDILSLPEHLDHWSRRPRPPALRGQWGGGVRSLRAGHRRWIVRAPDQVIQTDVEEISNSDEAVDVRRTRRAAFNIIDRVNARS